MKRIEAVLDKVLEDAFNAAMATLKEEASRVVAATLKGALEARLKALLEEEEATPTSTPTLRAKAKAQASPLSVEEEATPKTTPRRRKAKAQAQAPVQDDLESILEGVRVALQKYSGITTPKGKAYSDVLFRRVRKVLEHAEGSGHDNLALLARDALAYIATDPRSVAMGSWQYLAGKLGLPVPISQA